MKIQYLSYVIPGLSLLLSFYILLRSNIKQNTTELTTIIIKLENILENMNNIKAEISILKTEQKEDHDKMIRIEQSITAAWKKIDEINLLLKNK